MVYYNGTHNTKISVILLKHKKKKASTERLGTFQPDHLLEGSPVNRSHVKCDCRVLNAFISVPFDFNLFGLGLSLFWAEDCEGNYAYEVCCGALARC
jgi:hypothetical protein